MSINATNKIVIPSYQTAFNASLADGYFSYNLGIAIQGGVWPFLTQHFISSEIGALIAASKIANIPLGGDWLPNQGATQRAKSLELSFAAASIAGGEILDFNVWMLKTAVAKNISNLLEVECFKFCSGTATLQASTATDNNIIGEYYIGQKLDLAGNATSYAVSMTNTVTAHGQFMENQYGSVGADVWSPGGTAVAKLMIPECFGSSMALVEVKPHASGGVTIDTNNPVLIYASVEY